MWPGEMHLVIKLFIGLTTLRHLPNLPGFPKLCARLRSPAGPRILPTGVRSVQAFAYRV